MRNAIKRGALIAAIPVLAFTGACSATDSAASTPKKAPAKNAAPAPSTPQSPGAANPGLTAAELPAYQGVVECVRKHGVNLPDPKVGQPFDTAAMDAIAMTPKWSKILSECPEWTKVVVGVG
jgi:hypothetical protein